MLLFKIEFIRLHGIIVKASKTSGENKENKAKSLNFFHFKNKVD